MILSKFKSDEEEAAFWDGFDTAEILEGGEEIELEYEPEPSVSEIMCITCGKKMIERERDIDISGRGITFKIKEFYCPWCKKSRLGSVEAKKLSEVLVVLLGVRSGGTIERDTEVHKEKEGYFVKIPDEIARCLDLHENKRTKMWYTGNRIILEI